MQRVFRTLLPLAAAMALVPAAWAFSLVGPRTAWQTPAFGYNEDVGGTTVGPMQLNAFYRWNITNITYAYDESFLRYFGTNGVKAVDAAFAILNNVPAASQMNLDEFANDTKLINLQAGQAGLLDLKSHTLQMIFRYLGLTSPEKNVWALRNTGVPGRYFVIQRNYDPVTLQPSAYVNGVRYTYTIMDFGTNALDAVEQPQTLNNNQPYSSVAGGNLRAGEFFVGLTRDDMGGLKYLLSTNTLAIETTFPGVTARDPAFGSAYGWVPWFGNNAGSNTYTFPTNYFSFTTNNLINATNFFTNGIRGGANKIWFQKVAFDSVIGTTFTTVTNFYNDTVIISNRLVTQVLQRVVNYPDIIFVAEPLLFDAEGLPNLTAQTGIAFQDNDALNGLSVDGGPGIITGTLPVRLSFNSLLPGIINRDPYFLDEQWSGESLQWATFDNTPTAPVLYPTAEAITFDWLLNSANLFTPTIPQ